jgi:hypothetical protein
MPNLDDSLAEAINAEKEVPTPTEETTEEEGQELEENVTEEESADEVTDEGEDSPEVPAAKPHRANDTIRALKEERKAMQAERDALIERTARAEALQHAREEQRQLHQSAADRQAEEQRLAMLDPEERRQYNADKRSTNLEHQINLMQIQMRDGSDRILFESQGATDPLVKQYKDQVQAMHEENQRRGISVPREELLNLIVGREIRKNAAAGLQGKKSAASKRIDSSTSKPASARGDVAESRKGKSEEDRLRGVLI